MDANGQRFWLLADAAHFPARAHVVWDASCRALRLASERLLVPALTPSQAFARAQSALEGVPRAVDGFECVASWQGNQGDTGGAVIAHSHLPEEATLLTLDVAPRDLCSGDDGVLYLALPGRIRLHDLRARFVDVDVALDDFDPWRLAPRPRIEGAGVWVLERTSGRLARLTGRPLRQPQPQRDDYDAQVFRPEPENACAPRLELMAAPPWGDERLLGLACAPDGALVVLTWVDGDGHAAVRRWRDAEASWSMPLRLVGADYAYAVAWIAPDRVALRVPGRRDAPAFDLAGATKNDSGELVVEPLGDVYPLADEAREAPFGNGAVQPPRYPVGPRSAEPLHALSLNQLARRGEASNLGGSGAGARPYLIDSGNPTTVWHRLYAETALPAHCGFIAWLAATNDPLPPQTDDLTAWHPHGFGRDIALLDDAMSAPHVPRAAWHREASELPGHGGLLRGTRKQGERGLFSVLIQCSRQRARNLVGRYLWVRLVLHGDGRTGPEVAALRAWGSRFSYTEKYLPRLYREELFGEAATQPGEALTRVDPMHAAALDAAALTPALRTRLSQDSILPGAAASVVVERSGFAWRLQDGAAAWRLARDEAGINVYRPLPTRADFNARLLANFEGLLTTLEDRVAAAHLFTDPSSVPEEHLEWLAGWIGVAFDPALPATRRREWLRAAPDLARRHGTRDGLRLALDVATGGAVRGGELIVVENFRLRRILATLLGVDLTDERDPLLPGLHQSGNSVVGDTLVLGDAERVELMALFREEAATEAEDAAVISFYERLAHRATVLVHREVEPQDFALIRRVVQWEAPAHVDVSVVAASRPLLVGIASLVGVDTYLGPPRSPQPVRVQRSLLGISDFVIGVAALDPRISGAPTVPPPRADIAVSDPIVSPVESFILDGSRSRAAPGHVISEYRWRWLPPR